MKLAAILAQHGMADTSLDPATVERMHVEAIAEEQARRIRRLCLAAGLTAEPAIAPDADDCAELVACTDAEVIAYARALLVRAEREAGRVPNGWTQASECGGCGPVWLWPGAPSPVLACPWCWNRKAGRTMPKPP